MKRGEPAWPGVYFDEAPADGSGGGGGTSAPATDWTHWWLHNGDAYLDLGFELATREAVTGDQPDELRILRTQVCEEIVPAGGAVTLTRNIAASFQELISCLTCNEYFALD